jgi:N-acetylglucosamine-6-phosphate deacetylase
MTRPYWIMPDQLFDKDRLHRDMALQISDGRVAAVVTADSLGADVIAQPVTGTLTPGLIDLQVNGGGDVLLNQVPTAAGMAVMAAAHHRFGTVAILPTLITDAPDVLDRAASAVLAAQGQSAILGLHIEGPHIAVARRGTHAESFVRPLDQATINIVRGLRQAGIVVMITLAPEAVGPGQIAALAATGAVVSIGHSDATADQTRAALAQGASCFTHLFNAMSPMLNRTAGVVGAAINSDAYAGIICDGIHVADEMVGLAIRARPQPDRMFLVSDAMSTVGGSDHFTLYGQTIWLRDGQLVNEEGSLAGAHVTMAESVQRLVRHVGVPVETALRMAITVPAAVVRRPDLARIEGRFLRDLLVFDAKLAPRHLPDLLENLLPQT